MTLLAAHDHDVGVRDDLPAFRFTDFDAEALLHADELRRVAIGIHEAHLQVMRLGTVRVEQVPHRELHRVG